MDFEDITEVNQALKDSQEAEYDIRENVREAHHFIDKRDGQWEPEIINMLSNRPRYTLDKTGPIVDQISGEIDNADFTIRVRPSGGEATKDNAKIFDGLIRNIRNVSNAEMVFKTASRSAVTGGIDGFEIVQDYVDADSIDDQDLFIRKIHNYVDRVWFDQMAEEQDNNDARFCFVLSKITVPEYEKKFGEAPTGGIGDQRTNQVYSYKPTDMVMIGKFLYKKPRNIKLVKMSNGKTYREDSEEFQQVKDEFAAAGITEEKSRNRKSWRVYSRLFTNDKWLSEPEETVFDYLPVVALYGNYKVSENKKIYRGVVEKLIDPQRIYNYSVSRQIEEGALAPRDKFWMTRTQVAGNEDTLSTMNTNADPVQTYTHDPEAPGAPVRTNSSQVNQGLAQVAATASEDLNAAAGLFSANMGDNPGLQSGVALDIQTSKGDNGMTKWINMVEVAICYAGKVLINAIPRSYDSTRQVRILSEDGSFEMQTINEQVKDMQTGEIVTLNNLSAGDYDSVCEAGLAFKSKQKEAAAAFVEMAQVDPSLIELSGDILMKNMQQDGFEDAGERKRIQLINQGLIPQSQMTEEELQVEQNKQQQPQQPDAMMIAAQAEVKKAEAEMLNAQNKQSEIQGNHQIKMAQIQLEQARLQLEQQQFELKESGKFNVDAAKIQQAQEKQDLAAQNQQFTQGLDARKQQNDERNDSFSNRKIVAEVQEMGRVDTDE